MKKVFADADYLIALLNPRERLHARAQAASEHAGKVRLLTTQMVLAEVLAFYSDKGAAMRMAAATLASNLSSDPNVTVIPQTNLQFQEALSLYRQRADKE